MNDDPRRENLIPLFRGMPDAIVAEILATGRQRSCGPGTVLCRHGEPAVLMCLLRSGRVRFARTTASGDEVLFRWLSPGDCFGLASLLAGPAAYMATSQVVGHARVYEWDADTIRAAAAAHPRLAQNVLSIVMDYLREYVERHIALLSASAEQRLARALTRLGAASGRVLPVGVEVDITNRDLGLLADVGMFTVSRQLRDWERQGHLLKRRQRILLRHPEALLPE